MTASGSLRPAASATGLPTRSFRVAMVESLALTSSGKPDRAPLRALAERLEELQVDNARALGWSWQEIADALGVSKQTVHRKHRRVG